MASITVKNIEQDVLDGLAAKAALEGVSVQAYTREILRRFASVLSSAEIHARQQAARDSPIDPQEQERIAAAWSAVRRERRKW